MDSKDNSRREDGTFHIKIYIFSSFTGRGNTASAYETGEQNRRRSRLRTK